MNSSRYRRTRCACTYLAKTINLSLALSLLSLSLYILSRFCDLPPSLLTTRLYPSLSSNVIVYRILWLQEMALICKKVSQTMYICARHLMDKS